MHGLQGKRAECGQGGALDGDAQGDEGVVYCAAAVSGRVSGAWAGDGEVCEVCEVGEGGDKSRDVCGSVEERGVLLYQQVLHFPGAVFWDFGRRGAGLGGLDLGFIEELSLCAGEGVDEGWEEGIWTMGHAEGEGLDVSSYP